MDLGKRDCRDVIAEAQGKVSSNGYSCTTTTAVSAEVLQWLRYSTVGQAWLAGLLERLSR